ncbi:hypothetical protein LCGC14_0574080 [marine sediment metagenome]|uniref:DUF669 domain-containing protein n=1 Tax=marine sediment metagenome TaxID=412755 RepID=A0A0F9URL6_9ZZZZ
MDLNFEQLLAEHNQAFKDSEVYSNWMPPDGDYIASLVKFDSGQKEKDNVKTAWYKLTGRIEDVQNEKLNGKEFLVNFYRSSAYGIMKGDARILSGNSLLDDLKEAYEVLEASIGSVIRIRISTAFSDKYKKEFTNCYIQEVINTTTETSAEDVSNADTPASVETLVVGAAPETVPAVPIA